MPRENVQCEIAIIGGGPGGYAAALYASRLGIRSVVVEKDRIGGTCLHRGCIPTKHYLETASVLRTVKSASAFGISGQTVGDNDVQIEWSRILERKSNVVDKIFRGLTGLLKSAGVEVISGEASLDDSGRIRAVSGDGTEYELASTKGVILATGSTPKLLDMLPYDGRFVVTSDEVLDLDYLPRSVVVVGAGSVGVELSSYLAEFGCSVTIVEALAHVLPGTDGEIATSLQRSLSAAGVESICGAEVLSLEREPESDGTHGVVRVRTSAGEERGLEADLVVVAVGRRPVVENIGLDSVGITLERTGHIAVDLKTLETNVGGYYAVGDVIPTPALAHVAFAEGMVAVRALAGEDPRPIDYSRVPWCVYSHPEVAFCGLDEESARREHGDGSVKVSKVNFAANSRATIMDERRGMLKLVALEGGPVLGVHIVGPWASELLSPGYLATNWEAFPEEIAEYIQPHPTLSEILGEASMALVGRPLHG
jgi:dihydrolipoamide dehydrogenase